MALGVRSPVTSPTFTIGSRYRGRIPVAHLDLYRLDHLEPEVPDLLADYIGPDTITFVEWPERARWQRNRHAPNPHRAPGQRPPPNHRTDD